MKYSEEQIEEARGAWKYTRESEVREAWEESMRGNWGAFRHIDENGTVYKDDAAEDEAWNGFTDQLQKAGDIPPQMFYAGYDEDDPDTWE